MIVNIDYALVYAKAWKHFSVKKGGVGKMLCQALLGGDVCPSTDWGRDQEVGG